MRAYSLALLLGLASSIPGSIAVAQSAPASHPSFEVASIRLSNPHQRRPIGLFVFPGGRISASSCTFRILLTSAFEVYSFQISGGSRWINNTRYDISAILPPSSPARNLKPPSPKAPLNSEEREMLQNLLRDRFQLKFHWENKVGRAYLLVRGKGNLKLRPPKESSDYPWAGINRGDADSGVSFEGDNISMPLLAKYLSRDLGRPVLDKTGLKGSYDFHYRYSSNLSDFDVDSCIFTSISEIGLKLKSAKGPVRTIVIDHVEPPTPN